MKFTIILFIELIYLLKIVEGRFSFLNFSDEDQTLPENRVIGGAIADPNYWKFIVSINDNQVQFCGGSLVTADCVVTAGHCLYDRRSGGVVDVSSLSITAGVHNVKYDVGTTSGIARAVLFPAFRFKYLVNDLGILKLSEPIEESLTVEYIRLANRTVPSGTLCLTAGWGNADKEEKERRDKSRTKRLANKLMEVYLPAISFEECQQYYESEYMESTVMCTMAPQGTEDACQGDSGGPLICKEALTGVTSWGVGCGHPDRPAVWTDVAQYKDWIEETCSEPVVKKEMRKEERTQGLQYNTLMRRYSSSSTSFIILKILVAMPIVYLLVYLTNK